MGLTKVTLVLCLILASALSFSADTVVPEEAELQNDSLSSSVLSLSGKSTKPKPANPVKAVEKVVAKSKAVEKVVAKSMAANPVVKAVEKLMAANPVVKAVEKVAANPVKAVEKVVANMAANPVVKRFVEKVAPGVAKSMATMAKLEVAIAEGVLKETKYAKPFLQRSEAAFKVCVAKQSPVFLKAMGQLKRLIVESQRTVRYNAGVLAGDLAKLKKDGMAAYGKLLKTAAGAFGKAQAWAKEVNSKTASVTLDEMSVSNLDPELVEDDKFDMASIGKIFKAAIKFATDELKKSVPKVQANCVPLSVEFGAPKILSKPKLKLKQNQGSKQAALSK